MSTCTKLAQHKSLFVRNNYNFFSSIIIILLINNVVSQLFAISVQKVIILNNIKEDLKFQDELFPHVSRGLLPSGPLVSQGSE